jgi:hypothetical protein
MSIGLLFAILCERVISYYPKPMPFAIGSAWTGAPIMARSHETITMESLRVIIHLNRQTYTLEAVFSIYNSGQTISETIMFPIAGPSLEEDWNISDCPTFIHYNLWINSQKAAICDITSYINSMSNVFKKLSRVIQSITFSGPEDYKYDLEKWKTVSCTFNGKSFTKIRLFCEATLFENVKREKRAIFLLGTTASWKGPIKNVSIKAECSDIGGVDKCDFSIQDRSPLCRKRVNRDEINYLISNYTPLNSHDMLSVSLIPVHSSESFSNKKDLGCEIGAAK